LYPLITKKRIQKRKEENMAQSAPIHLKDTPLSKSHMNGLKERDKTNPCPYIPCIYVWVKERKRKL